MKRYRLSLQRLDGIRVAVSLASLRGRLQKRTVVLGVIVTQTRTMKEGRISDASSGPVYDSAYLDKLEEWSFSVREDQGCKHSIVFVDVLGATKSTDLELLQSSHRRTRQDALSSLPFQFQEQIKESYKFVHSANSTKRPAHPSGYVLHLQWQHYGTKPEGS
jgi:hypothetical protein